MSRGFILDPPVKPEDDGVGLLVILRQNKYDTIKP